MRLLGIETSGRIGSVALWVDGEVRASRRFTRGMVHGRELVPSIRAVLKSARLRPERLDAVAVSRGPGSYTGLRVGVTTAKVMAHTLGIRLVGVPTMEVIVDNVPRGRARYLAPVLDAKWDQVYAALFCEGEDGRRGLVGEARAVSAAEFVAGAPEGTLVFGDGVKKFSGAFEGSAVRIGREAWGIPRAARVAERGAMLLEGGRRDDPAAIGPVYLRASEAETKAGLAPPR
ncbi:MAG: tRNA (adenosine(37)-N6)-threonylcarbamoyltransferase complex dimerization subunit type 1 TsaB [Planctomycetes bacterium]|nr:tRNA (adenosine(37)-N6)-threonylcarbamoyltransferase complex dimerization subunit type 1 TsaB [Planctomycetota bacterium]